MSNTKCYPIWLLTLVAVAGCASSNGMATQGTQRVGGLAGTNITMSPSSVPVSKTVIYPIDQVWHLVPAAYDSATVPLTLLDPKGRVVGNEGFKVRQTLGKARLSSYFDCGATQVGPNADSYEMYIVIVTSLESDGAARTKITTTVDAAAKPLQFAQDYSRCTSKGVLEMLITDIITANLKK